MEMTFMKKNSKKWLSLFFAVAIILSVTLVGIAAAEMRAAGDPAPRAAGYYDEEYYYTSGTQFISDLAVSARDHSGTAGGREDESKGYITGAGYTLLGKDLNDGKNSSYIHMGYKKSTDESQAIRAIAFYNGSTAPANYTYNINGHDCTFYPVLNSYIGSSTSANAALDLNREMGGDTIYMYYTRDPNAGPPMTAIGHSENATMSGYTVCPWMNTGGEKGKINQAADLNAGGGGDYIYLFYQQTGTSVDTDALRTATTNGNNYLSNAGNYVSVYNLQTAVNSANNIINDYNSYGLSGQYDQNAINNAINPINTAINALQTKVNLNPNGGSLNGSTSTYSTTITIGGASSYGFSVASYVPVRTGYTFKGWATSASATSGSTGTINVGFNNTLYAVWEANKYTVVFDNLVDFSKWNTSSASNGVISNVTDNGFTLTSNDGAGEGTSQSPLFPVTPGKQYKIDIDFTGDAWDVYIFFYDANTSSGLGLEFNDGPTNRFSANGSTGITADNAVFTAPAGSVRAAIRVDANGSNNTVRFENIRVYEVGTVEDGVSYENSKTVTFAGTYGDLPVPTKTNHEFLGWYKADGTKLNASDTVNVADNLYVTSKWKMNGFTVTWKNYDGTVLETDNGVPAGTTPIYNGNTPTRPATDEYTYTFTSWTPSVSAITGDTTYTAQYSQTKNKYNVTWKVDGQQDVVTSVEYGIVPAYPNGTPTKAADAQYTYTFANWDTTPAAVTKDVTYTAVFDKKVNTYNVTWLNEDDSVLETDTNVEYGATPKYDGENPTKAADSQYTYEFAGWDPAVSTVTGHTSYKATFKSTLRSYTVNWVINDQIVETDTVEYGKMPEYNGSEPTKAATAQYSYKFDKWSPTVATVSGDVNYTATFTQTVNKYKVTWVDEDGSTVLYSADFDYGSMPVYGTANPTKAATAQYTYTFDGWDKAYTAVTEATTYTAKYKATVNKYTIKFVNEDGTELQSSEVAYGETPAYTGETPTKEATAQYTYTHNGWTPEIAEVTEDATYTATYSSTVNKYTITFVNEDGTELQSSEVAYGETPAYTGETPTKEATAQYTYTHNGWTPEIAEVTEDATYTATYSSTVNKYTITFVNEDGTELQSSEVAYGETPAYTGETPTKAATAQYTYTFAGWDPEIAEVTGEATYTATYSETVNTYTVTWVDEDGTVLETDEDVPYGATPNYDGATPSKAADAQYTYAFDKWSPEIATVTGDATYKATYSSTVNTYTVTWKNEDGTVLKTDAEVAYGTTPEYKGSTPTKAKTDEFTYTFAGWTPEISEVTGDAVYTATYKAEKNKYTITWVIDGKEETTSVEYGAMPTHADPVKAADAQYTYTFTGWTPEIKAVTGNATYTAQFSSTVNTYTVTWVIDGVETKETYEYGATPSHADPVKEADAQYTYTFKEWSPAIATVTGDATYTAVFDNTVNKYTVTWIIDGAETTEEYEYGAMPEHAEPEKEADAQYTYTFKEWSPAIVKVEKDATYTAVFDKTVNEYTITWIVDGEETTTTVAYGETPDFGSTPTKEATAEFTYTFDKWTPEIKSVTGAATYEAVFTATTNKYTVTWVDEDGTLLETDEDVLYGATPTFDKDNPTKEKDAQYEYAFAGWTPTVSTVTGNATYTATYSSTVRSYEIKWVVDGNTVRTDIVEYGQIPVFGEDPTKAETDEYTYTFAGWDSEVVAVTGPATYTAEFTADKRSYTITWIVDGNETTTTTVKYGETPALDDPTKAPSAEYTYTFKEWTPAIKAVTGDATYTAVFTETPNVYTITWVGYNKTVTTDVAYGAQIVEPAVPEQPGFIGVWENVPQTMPAEDITINAKYSQNVITVTWIVDGVTVKTDAVEYGNKPVFTGATPVKAPSNTEVYEFIGWSEDANGNGEIITDNKDFPEASAATGNKTYYAVFESTTRYYTITWKNGNDIIYSDDTLEYGETPEYNQTKYGIPTKNATAQYSYTFDGWDPAVAKVTGDATYTAQFKATVNTYTVTWIIDGKTETETYAYGVMPTHAEPTKAATAQYTYTFAGWDPAITTVTGDVTYTAKFNATVNKYTVTWVDENGTVLETDTGVEFGTKPTFDKANPTKAATAQYTYTFAGWEGLTDDTTVEGNVTFKATYSSAVNKYTVTWVNDDGSLIDTTTVAYGTVPTHADPSKAADAQYTYTFAGWDNTPVAVTGEATYKATYTSTVNKYTITWNIEGQNPITEEIEYGETPSYKGETPTKQGDAQYSYKFTGWTPAISAVTGKATYTAQFERITNKYTVTWIIDGVETTAEYEYGTELTPAEPTKAATAQYTYTFTGWSPALETVTKDATYTAQFSSTVNTYTVTWDIDGAKTTETYEYGATPSYKGEAPTKAATAQYTYTFAGWNGLTAETTVTGNVTFKANFSSVVNEYTITWLNDDGSLIDTTTVAYGTVPTHVEPTKAATAQYTFEFAGWDNTPVAVTGEATYKATYSSTVNKYTVKWVVEGTTVETDSNVPYGTDPVFNGSTPTKAATAQYTYTFAGWEPTISTVTGNVEYNATFTPVTRSYTITWLNDDGSVIDTTTVAYGTVPVHADPSKAADAQYTYTFAGWDNTPVAVTGEATYKATYTSTVNKYTVTWVVEGVTVETDENVEYGKTPSYDGDEPTKTGDAQYSYTFDKWTPEVDTVTGDITYTATFTQSVNKYTITWLDDNGSVIDTTTVAYGDVPTHADPTKAATAQYTYTFTGWDNTPVAVTGDATYKATYKENVRKYTITWVVNGTETKEQYEYNAVPSFKGSTDIPSTESTTYVFKGWNKEIANVTADATYTAEYDVTVKTHTITWIVGDQEIKQQWAYGTVPTFDGSTDKAPSATATYTFAGWDKTPVKVTGDATYTATYTETPRMYTVTWIVDGTVVKTEAVAYNAVIPVPGLPSDKEGHTVKWDNTVTVMPASDVEIHAIYTPRMYPVYWIVDGITVYSASVPYGTAIPEKAVPAKEGHTGKWLNVPATMPAGIVMINAEYTARSYQVFWKIGDVQNTETATYGQDLVLTFDIETLPEDLRITVNGAVLSADNYEYDAAAGTLKIYGAAITGNINIVAKSTSGSVNVLNSIFGGSSSNTNSVINMRTTYHTTITPAAGNLLPKTVAIYVDGILVTNGYSYDPATGKLTINAEVIVGELEIYAECPEDPNYNPTEDCDCACHSKNALVKFFFTIFNFLRELFGMKQYQYCECGVAHW